jgi:Glu-tRNA(Gln) amidotransferase subunit E-like FAD-binding protein
LVDYLKRLKKEKFQIDSLSQKDIIVIFDNYKKGKIVREGLLEVFRQTIKNGGFTDELLPKACINPELSEIIMNSKNDLNKISIKKAENRNEILMGLVMPKLRGRISGSNVFELINK